MSRGVWASAQYVGTIAYYSPEVLEAITEGRRNANGGLRTPNWSPDPLIFYFGIVRASAPTAATRLASRSPPASTGT